MLNTVFAATGLKLEYVREEFFKFVFLNTVQYILKDSEGQLYYFVISFDKTQDFWIDREKQHNQSRGLIWSGEVFGRHCSLYRYSPVIGKELLSKKIKSEIIEEITLSPQVISLIEKDFLDSYPNVYHDKIRGLKEYNKCFNLLKRGDRVRISKEYGIFSKEQIGIVDNEPTVNLCNFRQRDYQLAGYNEYVYKKNFGGKGIYKENGRFNRAKYLLEKKIETLINTERQPIVISHAWNNQEEHMEQFALNNFPLIYPNNQNYILTINADYAQTTVALSIDNNKAVLGTWMSGIGREFLLQAVRYVFKNNKKVKKLEYQNLLYDTIVDHGWKHNDFYLPLPKTVEELKERLSSKGRYNIKREKRIIEDAFSDLQLKNISYEDMSENQIETFYAFKNATHGVSEGVYDITKRNLTDVYLLTVSGGDIKGMALSCEQGKIVFIENHTFDSSMRQYSFGQVLYDMYLDKMIEKGKTGVALAGGNLEYKKRYGTYCAIARSGEISRLQYLWLNIASKLKIDCRSFLFRRIASKLKKKCH